MSCPLGLDATPETLEVWSSKELAGLDAEDASEIASLLGEARRPANVAFLRSLAKDISRLRDQTNPWTDLVSPWTAAATEAAAAAGPLKDSADIAEVRRLLGDDVRRPRNVAALAALLPAGQGGETEEDLADQGEVDRLLAQPWDDYE